MADTAASVLCHWEATSMAFTPRNVIVRKSESGTVLTCESSLQSSKQAWQWTEWGLSDIYILFIVSWCTKKSTGFFLKFHFFWCRCIVSIAPLVKQFFIMLRAVLQVPQYLAGCKALGLINKMATGHHGLYLKVTILDMNDRYQQLKSKFWERSCVATCELSGTTVLFDDFPPVEDTIFSVLIISPSEGSTFLTRTLLLVKQAED